MISSSLSPNIWNSYIHLFILSPVQKDPTLIDVSYCVHLHSFCILLRIAGSCCAKFETGQTFEQAISNISFVLWSPKRGATMLDSFAQLFQHPRTHITHGLQKSYGLHPSHYALQPNIVGNAHHCQRCWLNIVGSWPCSRGSKTNPNFQLVNKPVVLQSWLLIQSIIYLWRIKRGRGGGLKRERELINFLPLKSEGELIREGA